MYHQRPRKENNECQTDLQCTPFILNENETAKVQSSRLCQTEIQLSPRSPDTDLYKIIPFIDEDDIERNAIRLVNITRNRKIKLHFVLPEQKTNSSPASLDDNDCNYIVTDGVDEEVTNVKKNENPLQCFSKESFHKNEIQILQTEDVESVSSIGTLKSAIKKILREDDSTQTDLMIAPHVLNDHEKAIITIHNSCQTSVTCTPRTSLTEVVPMLRSYWEHQGETREAFNKSENVLEILKEIIQDVINIHQHMFDPNYNLPDMNTVLVKLGPKNSSMESSEWDTISPSKNTKKTIMDVSGDGSFENATLSDLDSSFNNKYKDDNVFNESAIASISTISEVTTLRSSDFTLTSTKDEDDIDVDDDIDGISDILDRLKKKYTPTDNGEDDGLTNVKTVHSEPIITTKIETVKVTKAMSDTNNSSSKPDSSVELFGSELWSENDSSRKEVTFDDPKEASHNCQMINSNCVCSGIKIKLYLKDKFDNNKGSSDRFIEMKIKPDLETVEIKKLLNISTDPGLAEICSNIPFQEIENCLKDETDDSNENLVKLFDVDAEEELLKADICKSDGFQIKINLPKKNALSPQTKSEEFLQSFLLTNFLLKDIESTPFPEIINKVSFPHKTCGNADDDNTGVKLCSCDTNVDEKSAMPNYQKPVSETLSPFTEVFSRLYEDRDNLIPYDTNDLFCECKHGDNEVAGCDTEHKGFPGNKELDMVGGVCNSANDEYISGKSAELELELHKKNGGFLSDFSEENRILKNMSSYVVFPSRAVKSENHADHYSDAVFNKPGIVITRNKFDTNSITYDGRVYQTDSFFLPGGSDGSDDSSSNIIVDKAAHHKSRKQTYTISYEEHMYKTDGDIVPHISDNSLTDLDCICALKLEQSLRECPHCFRRIGPQYGRDQRGLNDDYDQSYGMKDLADYCSTKQNTTEPNKGGPYPKQFLASTSGRFISNDPMTPSHQKLMDNNFKETVTFYTDKPNKNNNLMEEYINTGWYTAESGATNTYFIERTHEVKTVSESTPNSNESNNLIDNTGQYTSKSDTTKNVDASNDLAQRTNNINSSNKLIEGANNTTDKYNSESGSTKNNITVIYASKNEGSSKHLMEESDTTKNLDAFNNVKESNTTAKPSEGNVDTSEEPRSNVDADLSKYLQFTEKVYSTGKIVIGKMNDDNSDAIKFQNADSISKCNICFRNKPCPKILCEAADVINQPINYECSKSADEGTPSMTADKNATLLLKKPLEVTSSLDKIIANMQEKYKAKPKNKCQTCSKAKLKKASKNNSIALDTPSLDKIIADMEQRYKATSKTKCKTCSKAKLNQTSNKNVTMVTIERICSICSSKDGLIKKKQTDVQFKKSRTCSAICNKGNGKPGIKLEEKKSVENLQKIAQKAENLRTQQTKDSTKKKCLSCSNLANKDSHVSNTLNHQDKFLTAPKTKCSTCKKIVKASNTVQVLYSPISKSLYCTCIKSKCRLTQNMEETVCLKKKSTQDSIKKKCLACKTSKRNSMQIMCSEILHNQLKKRLENLAELPCKPSNLECPGPPANSIRSNCKCNKCVFSENLDEANISSPHSSKCHNLPNNSIQKIFEKNLPCSCSSSNTNQKEDNCGHNLDYLTDQINQCFAKCNQSKDTSKSTIEIAKDKIKEPPIPSEQNISDSDLKINLNSAENKSHLEKKGKKINDQFKDEDLLSTFSIITQPKVRILDAPKYIYKSYSSVSNDDFLLESEENKETFLYNSLNDLSNVNKYSAKNVEQSQEEFLMSNVSESSNVENEQMENGSSSKTTQGKSTNSVKTLNVHKLDGKYSVFSIEKKHDTGGSQTTVYILPNAIFSSLLSIPPPQFLRERTKSEIDDIIQFSHIRNLHYERNPEFDQKTNATENSNHNSEQFINIIANQNLPNLNCETTCSCSSSVPKNQEQQTDKIFDKIKADKATSITSLQKSENKVHSEQSNSVGVQSSYVLFHTCPHSEKTSFSSILKPSYKKQKFLDDNNVKLLENTLNNVEPNPMQIMGKYITWKDLISPNLYNPIPIQNAITSLEPFINYPNQKVDRGIQTSNMSFINAMSESSMAPPLTIEASTSTGNLEMEASVITTVGYHLSENFSTIDLPLDHPSTSDYSLSTKNKTFQKYMFQTPSATKNLKRTIFPILTLEASTSTTSRNQEMEQPEEVAPRTPKHSLANCSLDKNLIEGQTTSMSKYEAYEKTSTLEFPTNITSISLTKISTPFKHPALEKKSSIPEASTSKVQTNIGLSTTSPNIASPYINSTPEALPGTLVKSQETSTNDMSPAISLTKFTLSNISVLQEPNLPKLANVDSYSHIPLIGDQISCLSLPKVESLDSIPESNCDPTDTDIAFKNDLNHQEWSYPHKKERLPQSKKFLHKTNSPSELFMPSKEIVSISLNSKHGDISIIKNDSPVQKQAPSKPESTKENNEPFRDSISSESFNFADLKAEEVVNSESSKFISNINEILSARPKPKERDHNFNSSAFERYYDLGLERNSKINKELKDSPLNASNSNILQREAGNIPQESIHKNLQLENLLSRAIDAYTAYLTLKKGISSNFNVSKIDLPYQHTDPHVSSKLLKEDEKDFLQKDHLLQQGSKELLTDSLSSKIEDYYSAYLKRKDRISSLISIAKLDSSSNNLDYNKEGDKNSLELSDINVDSHHIHNSRDDFLSKTEQAYSKVLQRKDESPKISVSNIYSSFEDVSKKLQIETTPAKNPTNYQYYLSSEASTINDFKLNSLTPKNKVQDAEIAPLSLKNDLSYQTTSSKSNLYRNLRSNKFMLKKDDGNSEYLKSEEKLSSLNRDSNNSKDQNIKIEKDISSIESEYSEILKRKQTMYSRASRNSNQRLFSYKNEDSYLRRSKQEENESLSTLSSVKGKNLAQNSLASGVSNNNDKIINKLHLKNKDDHHLSNKNETGANLITTNSPYQYSTSVRPKTSKDLKSEKFIYNTKGHYSPYTVREKETLVTPYNQPISKNRSSKDLKSNDYSTYTKKDDFTSPRKSTSTITPTYLHSMSENRSSKDFKSNNYTTYPKKEEPISPRRSVLQSASPYSNSVLENINSTYLKSNEYSTYTKKEEPISPRRSVIQSASPYPNSVVENRNSTNLKSNEYSTHSKKVETISPRRSVLQNASPYLHSVAENINSTNSKSNEYSTYPKKEEPISPKRSVIQSASPYQNSVVENRISTNLISNEYSTYSKKKESISPRRSVIQSVSPYSNSVVENKNSTNLKSNEYSTYPNKEEPISPRRSVIQSASPYPNSVVENRNSTNLKSNEYSTYPKIEETITPRRSSPQSASLYANSINLKSNEYSTYSKKEEINSPRRSVSPSASPYPHSTVENRSSRNSKTSEYSTYPLKEETISPGRSFPQSASPYPHSISENKNSRDLKSNKFIHSPESKEKTSLPRNLITENDLSLVNNNSANNKNSATSKLSSFVRNGTTSSLLGNISDSTQQLSMEEIDNILPEIAVSSHRVLEAVQSCEQRLQPIKNALKDIKMKLKELNMPEVNGIFQNDHLVDENNKTYIYLPPPPPPLVSSRCSYRTKMTFQLKKPIKPLSVTANVNPFSIKHKFILNDSENNHGILNTNYSSVSDPPPYYIQRKSMNSINPNFNQPSHSENKPLHSQRYHPDTYFERSHPSRNPVEVIEEDLPFSPENLEGRKAMNEFQQYQYLPNNYEMYYYQPRTESLNNYVVFPPVAKSSRVYVPVTNSFYKTDEHVFNNPNIQNNMFTGDYPLWKNKQKK